MHQKELDRWDCSDGHREQFAATRLRAGFRCDFISRQVPVGIGMDLVTRRTLAVIVPTRINRWADSDDFKERLLYHLDYLNTSRYHTGFGFTTGSNEH